MNVLLRFSLRALTARPGRAVLTLMSIVIAVAAVVAVQISTVTTQVAYRKASESITGRADLEIVAEGGGAFDLALRDQVRKVAGVSGVLASYQQVTNLFFNEKKVRALLVGIETDNHDALRDYELREGKLFDEGSGALMESGFAEAVGVKLNDEVRILTAAAGLMKRVPVVGILRLNASGGVQQVGALYLPLDLMQRYYRRPGKVTVLSVTLTDSRQAAAASEAISKILPEGISVRTPAQRMQMSGTMEMLDKGLLLTYIMTMVLAVFIVFNTFLMNVSERRKQLAILRAVGTTRGQMVRMLLTEALLLGVVGTVIGCLLGLCGAFGMSRAMGKLLSAPSPEMQITQTAYLLGGLLGPCLALFSAAVPAWIARRVSPLEGMRPVIVEDKRGVSVTSIVVGITAFVTTGAMLFASLYDVLPVAWAMYSGVAFTASFVLLLLPLLGVFARAVSRVFNPILKTEGRLAARQTLRRRLRSALTVGVIYMSIATGIQIGTLTKNSVDDIREWQRRTIKGDFFVRAMMPDMSTGESASMPETLGDEMRKVPGITHIDTIRFLSSRVGEMPVLVLLREFSGRERLPLYLVGGKVEDIRERLFRGEVVIGTVLAKKLGLGIGDEIRLKTREGERGFRIAGFSTEYMMGGLIVNMERNAGKKLFGVDDVSFFMIHADSEQISSVEHKLRAMCETGGLMLQSFGDLRRRIDDMLNGLVASLWGLLCLGLIIAGFGIANTLTMNVLEQTRELAMLRVVSMTRQQIRKTILAQATVMGIIGLIAGGIGGIIGAYIGNFATWKVVGQVVAFHIDPWLVSLSLLLAFGVILLAAWLPARRASQLNLLIALQYE